MASKHFQLFLQWMKNDIKFISERVSYRKTPEELTIIITGKIEKGKETLLLTWLLAWTFCGIFILIQLFGDYPREEKLYFFIFLVFWAFFEFKILNVYRWRKWGKEYLRVADGKLTIKKSITEFAKSEEYFMDNIKNIRINPKNESSFMEQLEGSFWVLGNNGLCFDYHAKTIQFGLQLEEKEKQSILRLLTNS